MSLYCERTDKRRISQNQEHRGDFGVPTDIMSLIITHSTYMLYKSSEQMREEEPKKGCFIITTPTIT